MWSAFIHLFSHGQCRLCHAPTTGGAALCHACRTALPLLQHPCPVCALPLPPSAPPDRPCGECLADPPPFSQALVPLLYREPLNTLISRFKYHHALADGRLLGDLLGAAVVQARRRVDLIVPVPLHAARLRERGFNQAGELARRVSAASGIAWHPTLLARRHDDAHQREAGRRRRKANVRNAFSCSEPVPGLRIALVDDVITTGATARAAARALQQAGAAWIEVWAVARTPRPGDEE